MAEEISSELGEGVTAMDGGLGSEISYFGDKEASKVLPYVRHNFRFGYGGFRDAFRAPRFVKT